MPTFYTKTKKGCIQGSLRNTNITMFNPRSEFIYQNSVDRDSSYEPWGSQSIAADDSSLGCDITLLHNKFMAIQRTAVPLSSASSSPQQIQVLCNMTPTQLAKLW